MDKKKLREASCELLKTKYGFEIIDEKSKWADFFAKKDDVTYSVAIVVPKNKMVIKENDVLLKCVAATVLKNKIILCSEFQIAEDIRALYPTITFFSIH